MGAFFCKLIPLLLLISTIGYGDDRVLKPEPTPSEDRLLILLPGADLSYENYRQLLNRIQKESSYDLWITSVSFMGGFPNPIQMGNKLDEALKLSQSQGFDGEWEQTFVAGHSLAGIMARDQVAARQAAGFVLLASYFPKSSVAGRTFLKDYPVPVLTLGGELDGLTRLSYLDRQFQEYKEFISQTADPKVGQFEKPVILIPGINHTQFADGYDDESDLAGERTLEQAHLEISRYLDAFMVLRSPSSATFNADLVQGKKTLIQKGLAATEVLLSPLMLARKLDDTLCKRAQEKVAALDPDVWAGIDLTVTPSSNFNAFLWSKPQWDEKTRSLEIHFLVERHRNIMDVSKTPLAPKTIGCKMKSRETIAGEGESISCQEINNQTIEEVQSLLTPEQRQRYLTAGTRLTSGDDIEKETGFNWVGSSLVWSESEPGMVQSTALKTGPGNGRFAGMHYCKLLAPSLAAEWMLVDGLR